MSKVNEINDPFLCNFEGLLIQCFLFYLITTENVKHEYKGQPIFLIMKIEKSALFIQDRS